MDKDLSKNIEAWEALLRQANEMENDAIKLLGMPPKKITSEGPNDKDLRFSSLMVEFNVHTEILLLARLLNNHIMEESIWRSLKLKLTGKKLETNIVHVDEIAMSAVDFLHDL